MFDEIPYLIAEIGVNHENDIDVAHRMIDEAASAGADAVKFQSYKAETLASKHSPSYWDTTLEPATSQYQLFKRFDNFKYKEYEELAAHCRQVGIDFVSTPFDIDYVHFLAPLVPFFKISSADITNFPLMKAAARYQKPVVLSTGASFVSEIWRAVEYLKSLAVADLTLLHCVLSYPTKNQDANLRLIPAFKKLFPRQRIGYSDHTVPDPRMIILTTAYLLGAEVIEKHYTLDKTLPGNDHYHAMTPEDIRIFKENVQLVQTLLGGEERDLFGMESLARQNARRSIYSRVRIRQGEHLSEENLIMKRPGTGLSPESLVLIVGSRAACDIDEDVQISLEMLKFGSQP